jgi:hypothetical protein
MAQNKVFSLGGIGSPCCCSPSTPMFDCSGCDIPEVTMSFSSTGPPLSTYSASLLFASPGSLSPTPPPVPVNGLWNSGPFTGPGGDTLWVAFGCFGVSPPNAEAWHSNNGGTSWLPGPITTPGNGFTQTSISCGMSFLIVWTNTSIPVVTWTISG